MRHSAVRRTIFAVTALGNFISMLNASAVNIALYRISKDFGLPVMKVQWVILAYMILLTGLLTLFGRLGDIVNRKWLYASGFAVFGVGSLMAFLSSDLPVLIVARLVQAVGGAALIANSFTIVSSVFKGATRGKALGFLGAATHLAAMISPALSGFLMEFFPWQSIFMPGIVVSAVGTFLAYRFIPASFSKEKTSIDVTGTVLLLICVTFFLLLVAQASTWPWNSPQTGICIGGTVVFLVLFGVRETTTAFPLIRFDLFRDKTFLFANLALGISYPAMYANVIMFPIYAQEILKLSPFETGVLIFPFSLSYLLIAISTGTVDPFRRMRWGMSVMIACLVAFALMGKGTPVLFFGILQAVMGASNGLFQPAVNLAILNASPKQDVGMASGVLSLARNTGIATGGVTSVLFFDAFKQRALSGGATFPTAFLTGYHAGLYIGAAFGALCLMFVVLSKRRFFCVR